MSGIEKATPEQIALELPTESVGIGMITTLSVSLAGSQGPAGSLVVSIRLTLPAAISAALGV